MVLGASFSQHSQISNLSFLDIFFGKRQTKIPSCKKFSPPFSSFKLCVLARFFAISTLFESEIVASFDPFFANVAFSGTTIAIRSKSGTKGILTLPR